jgi:hypothetical protein
MNNPDSDIDEQHVSLLSPSDVDRLRDSPIFLVFATGFRTGLDKVQARLRELARNLTFRELSSTQRTLVVSGLPHAYSTNPEMPAEPS